MTYVRRRDRRVTVKKQSDMLRRFPPAWVVTCEGCGKQWRWDRWGMAMLWAESTAEHCCRSLADTWRAKPASRPIGLWTTRTTSSGAFPKARREKDKFYGAKKED